MNKEENAAERSARMAKAREELAAYDQERMEQAAKQAAEVVAPAKDLCESSEFKIVIQKIKESRMALIEFEQLTSLLNSLVMLGDSLPTAINRAEQQALQQIQQETNPII